MAAQVYGGGVFKGSQAWREKIEALGYVHSPEEGAPDNQDYWEVDDGDWNAIGYFVDMEKRADPKELEGLEELDFHLEDTSNDDGEGKMYTRVLLHAGVLLVMEPKRVYLLPEDAKALRAAVRADANLGFMSQQQRTRILAALGL